MCGNITQKVWQYGVAIWPVGKVIINPYSNEVNFISLLSCNQLGWWHEQWGGGPHQPPIGHQELRVEVTWATRRRIPTPIGHQEFTVEVTWAMRRRTPYSPPSLVIRSWELKWHEHWGVTLPHWSWGVASWSDMSNEEEDPHPTPSHHFDTAFILLVSFCMLRGWIFCLFTDSHHFVPISWKFFQPVHMHGQPGSTT